MLNKYQVDRDTRKPEGNETDKQRLERLKRRVAWNLDLYEDDKKFFEERTMSPYKGKIIESNKEAKINETPDERKARLKELAKKKVKYLKSLPNQSGGSSTSDTPATFIGKRGGRYTKDTTKDGRPYRRYF